MLTRIAIAAALCACAAASAADFVVTGGFVVAPAEPEPAPAPPKKPAPYDPAPPGVKYQGARYTQSIFVLNDRDTIRPEAIKGMSDKRWHQPGGLEGVSGWTVERFRHLPPGTAVRAWVGNVSVKNGFTPTSTQQNRGILRSYPDGTRFDEVLRNADGAVFEHRVREKRNGKWLSTVHFKDEAARPAGYHGLTVSCSSCHAEAGTGKYAEGLVPGGDTVLSDPLPWRVWTRTPPEPEAPVAVARERADGTREVKLETATYSDGTAVGAAPKFKPYKGCDSCNCPCNDDGSGANGTAPWCTCRFSGHPCHCANCAGKEWSYEAYRAALAVRESQKEKKTATTGGCASCTAGACASGSCASGDCGAGRSVQGMSGGFFMGGGTCAGGSCTSRGSRPGLFGRR